jgi:hypothetical protein
MYQILIFHFPKAKDVLRFLSDFSSYSGDYAKLCLLLYNAVLSGENQPAFRRNISLPSSASNIKPSNTLAETDGKLSSTGFASFFLGFLFNLDEGADMFLRNVVDFLRTT